MYVYMCILLCVATEPDLGMEPGLAHHFFLQLLNGVVSCPPYSWEHTCTFSVCPCMCAMLYTYRSTYTVEGWLTEISNLRISYWTVVVSLQS